jgi:hypothetical protein
MAESWLSQFADQLASINSAPGASMRGASTPSAISQILANRVQDATPPPVNRNLNPSLVSQIVGAGNNFHNAVMSGGQHILDLLGRTDSAAASFKDYQLTHQNKNDNFLQSTLHEIQNLPGAFNAGLQGIEGNSPVKSFSDVLQHQGVNNPWVKGIGGFAADVALDPLSYVGPGEVKAGAKLADKGLQKLGFDIPGKLADFKAPTNAAALVSEGKQFAPATALESPAATTLEHIAPQNTSLAESAGLADKAEPLQKTAPAFSEPVAPVDSPIPAAGEVTPNSAKLAQALKDAAAGKAAPAAVATPKGLASTKASIKLAELAHTAAQFNHDSLLKGVEVHAPQLAEEVPPAIAPAVEKAVEPAAETPVSAAETLKNGIRSLAQENWHNGADEKGVALLGRSGVPLRDFSKGAVEASKAGTIIPAKVLLTAAQTGKIPAELENAYIKVNGQLTKLSDHLGQLHNDFKLGDVFGATRETKAIPVPAVPAPIPTQLKDFASMEELQAARKAKQLTPAGEAAYKAKMAKLGFRTHTQATAAVKRAAAALEKAKAPLVKEPLANETHVAEVASNVKKILQGDTTAIPAKEAPAALNENMARAVEKITKDTHHYVHLNPNSRRQAFDKFSQLTLGKKVIAEANKMVAGLPERQRAAALYDHAMPMMDAAERVFKQNGVPLILGKGLGSGLPVSIHDVLSALPRKFVERFYFTKDRAPGITHIADIAEQFIHHGLGDIPTADLKENIKTILMQDMGKTGVKSMLAKTIGVQGGLDKVAGEFTKAFTEAQPKLMEALTRNASEQALKDGLQTKALTEQTIAHLTDVINNPGTSVADLVKTALDTHGVVNSIADATGIPKAGPTRALAEQAAKAEVASSTALPQVSVAAKGAKEFAKAETKNAKVGVAVQLSKASATEADAMLQNEPELLHDLGTRAEFRGALNGLRAMFPHIAMEDIRPRMLERFSVKQDRSKLYANQLAKINSRFTTDQLAEAFRGLQDGRPMATEATQALNEAMAHLFTDQNAALGLLTRNFGKGEDVARGLEQKLARYGLRNFKIDPANLDQSWKKWENVKDPLDVLSRFDAAVGHSLAERELGAQISDYFGRTAPAADGKWVKVVDNTGKSKVAALIDTNKYYPDHVVNQLHLLDDTLKEFMKPNSSNALVRQWDTIMHSYKAGLTIWHVGHHVRNMVGDTWFSHMAGVTTPSPYYKALSAMATRASHYDGFDSIAALNNAYKVDAGGQVPKTILTIFHGGKEYHLTPSQVYTMAFDRGLLHDYSMIEDLNFGHLNQSSTVSNALKKVSPLRLIGAEGKAHSFAAKVSEHREHYVRLAHFIDYMGKNNHIVGPDFESAMQQATSKAADVVRKWHPDGTDMTPFERNKLRRAFTFYSWIRKAIPLVVESAVMRPGRFMVYPKAMHNLAASQGIQTNGMGNPFPTDQLFPEYISDSVQGPQWGGPGSYAGIKPGVPGPDVLDQYLSSPMKTLQTIMGSTNPAIKIPYEVATGHETSGATMPGAAQYIDQQLPYGSVLDALTGREASTGFTQPVPVSKSNTGYGGNPNTGGYLRTIINQLTGGGLTDYSKPSMIKAGQLDLKKRLKAGG